MLLFVVGGAVGSVWGFLVGIWWCYLLLNFISVRKFFVPTHSSHQSSDILVPCLIVRLFCLCRASLLDPSQTNCRSVCRQVQDDEDATEVLDRSRQASDQQTQHCRAEP